MVLALEWCESLSLMRLALGDGMVWDGEVEAGRTWLARSGARSRLWSLGGGDLGFGMGG